MREIEQERIFDVTPHNVEVCNRHSGSVSSWCRLSCVINHETGKLPLETFLDVLGPFPTRTDPTSGELANPFREITSGRMTRTEVFAKLLKKEETLRVGFHFYGDALAVDYGAGKPEDVKKILLEGNNVLLVGDKHVGRLVVSC